jgi:inorganic pyrophosphatase
VRQERPSEALEDAGRNDFPYHFGFIPRALAEDGDPLNVLILTDELNFSGCEVNCAIVGTVEGGTEDEGTEELSE